MNFDSLDPFPIGELNGQVIVDGKFPVIMPIIDP